MRWVLAALLFVPTGLSAADRSKPPSPGPARPLHLPLLQRFTLSNGLAVELMEFHKVPSVEILLLVRSGATSDPLDKAGLAAMTAQMLDEGARGKDSLALADAFDFLGADLATSSSWDASVVRLHVPASRAKEALPLFADVVFHPDFPVKELDRLRRETLTGLLQARDEPRQIASRATLRAVFGTKHRYGVPAAGDARSIAALKREDVASFWTKHYRPENATLIVTGDASASIVPLLEEALGSWAKGEAAASAWKEPAPLKGRRILLVDKPGAAQSVIRFAQVGPPRATPDYPALQVMNTLLGGSFTSRLNSNLREKHGWAYGAGSRFDYRRSAGLFVAAADVQTQSTGEALREFLKELEAIRLPATAEEVERARNYLALGYAIEFETTEEVAAQLANQTLYALPGDFFETFIPKAPAVTAGELQKVAQRAIDPKNMAVVIVGDRSVIEKPVRALNWGPLTTLSVEDLLGPPPKVE